MTSKTREKLRPLVQRFRFEDGSVSELPLEAVALQWLEETCRMFTSEELRWRAMANQRLKKIARIVAAADALQVHRAIVSKRPRPGRKSSLRARVIEAMKTNCGDYTCKEFLDGWEQSPIDDLVLAFDRPTQSYVVEDERAGDSTSYGLSTLERMYSEARQGKLNR